MMSGSLATLQRSSEELIQKLEWLGGATCEEAEGKQYARGQCRETTSQSQALESVSMRACDNGAQECASARVY